jgi:HSP90 family molecular chaperone
MKKFETILNRVIEEVTTSSSVTVNPQQISSDLKKVMTSINPATKKALQAIADPLENSTEVNPEDDLLNKIDELDFEKLPTEKKEKFVLSLMKKGILKEPQKTGNETQQTSQATSNNSPTSYGV